MQKIGEYKNYIFDVDGTLYFDRPVIFRMSVRLFFYYLVRPWRIKELFIVIKFRKDEEKGNMITPTPLIREWLILRPRKLINKYRDVDLISFLKKQKQAGKVIITYSNFLSLEKIEALGLTQSMDYQFFPDGKNITTLKPCKKGMEYILRETKIKISETLFIGDRQNTDGEVSETIGMDYIILSGNKRTRARQIAEAQMK